MNRKLFGALAIAILALVVNANAQNKAKADIPFSFDLGSKALPAGTYTVEKLGMSAIVIRNADTLHASLINVQNAERLDPQRPKLVFHRYGDQYFLYQVWSGSTIGVEIPASRHEKEVRMARAGGAAPQEVVVALR